MQTRGLNIRLPTPQNFIDSIKLLAGSMKNINFSLKKHFVQTLK